VRVVTGQRTSYAPLQGSNLSDLMRRYAVPFVLWAGLAAKLTVASHKLECCGPFERAPLITTLAGVLWLALPTLWFSSRARVITAITINLLSTLIVLADLLHARFYGDPSSVSELVHAWQLRAEGTSVTAALRAADAWYFLDLAAAVVVAGAVGAFRSIQSSPVPRAVRLCVAITAAGLTVVPIRLAVRDPDGVFEFFVGRRQVVNVVGLLGYHAHDVVTHLRFRTFGRWGVGDVEIQQAADDLSGRRGGVDRRPPLWGTARGSNLIVIQAESLQAFALEAQVDGRFVMPNLRALARESLWATNFFNQAAVGGTSDAAFITLQSLHPLDTGAVATRYPTNRYRALPSILEEHGVTTRAFSGAGGEFWNLRVLLASLGFSESCFDCQALTGMRFGQGLADGDFFKDVVPELRRLREPFFAFLMTQSNHHPYDLPKELNPLPVGRLSGTLIGRYLQTAHYFDESLGQFLRALAESGVLDRSLLVVYGDHLGYLGSPPELKQLLDLPSDLPIRSWEVNRRLPLMIRLPHAAAAGVQPRPVGHVDIAPTLLGLLGIEAGDEVMLGKSLLDDRSSLVVFRDGGFVAGGSYLLTQPDPYLDDDERRAGTGCYDSASGKPVGCGALESARREAIGELKLSDLILRGDLIPALRERLRGKR
jgi:phosphoglycerol transferase MdoB-like AlkP superfamily enzyme